MSSGKEFNEEDLRKIFKQIDTNNDNSITKDEMMIFIEGLMENDKNFRFYTVSEL